MLILGIDPGSIKTGFGCIEIQGRDLLLKTHGTFKSPPDIMLFDRLHKICKDLQELLNELPVNVVAIEKVFFAKNAASALVLGQIRGALIVTAKNKDCQIVEYSPTQVKSAITGHGRAEKEQLQRLLMQQFKIDHFSTLDASDGLALAVCHSLYLRKSFLLKQDDKNSLAKALSHRIRS